MRPAALVLATLLAGCAAPVPDLTSTRADDFQPHPVVLAVLDSGVIPYVSIFDDPDPSWIEASIPIPFETVPITHEGPRSDRLERDEELLESLEIHRLYHFAGTRVLGIGFSDRIPKPTIDGRGHGSGTTFVAGRDAPRAIILSVQVDALICPDRDVTCLDPSVADGMEWIADQDWIDVVSVSLASLGNLPDHAGNNEAARRYLAASEKAARSGKIIVNAAGNFVVPAYADFLNGPPWIVNVGGFESNASGESVFASKMVDVVANFSEYTSYGDEVTYRIRSGTSFATPVVAATLATALDLVRQGDPARAPTTQQMRDALNATATYAAPTSWKPVPPSSPEFPADPGRLSLPVVIQPQMGWGYIHAGMAPEIARRVLAEDFTIPTDKAQAQLFQPAYQKARETFWAAYG